jgi:hypothetical protein
MYAQIPWIADPLESAQYTLGTTAVEKYPCTNKPNKLSRLMITEKLDRTKYFMKYSMF